MENQNRNPWELDNTSHRRNDHGVAGAYHVIDNNEQDRLDPLTRRISNFDTLHQRSRDWSAIHPLTLQGPDINISPQIVALVQQNQYHSTSTENPMNHIDLFQEICDIISSNENYKNYARCKLFSFFLREKAIKWLRSLPPASITTWEECKAAFLNCFYPWSRSNLMRNKILNFKKEATKSFSNAWERFTDYERDCPRSGFTEGHMMIIFYRRVKYQYWLGLDTTSNGVMGTSLQRRYMRH